MILDGKVIGKVTRYHPTLERRTPGKTYVNARWTAKSAQWKAEAVNGRESRGHTTRRVASIWLMSQLNQENDGP